MAIESAKVICISLKYSAADYGLSGITMVFLKADCSSVLGINSINIYGDDLFLTDLSLSVNELFFNIANIKERSATITANEIKIHDRLLVVLNEKYLLSLKEKIENKDTGAVCFEFRRLISLAITSKEMKIQGSISTINESDFLLFNVFERIASFTYSKKVNIVKKYTNNPSVADDITHNMSQDVSIALFVSSSVAAIFFCENKVNRMVYAVATSDAHVIKDLTLVTNPYDFYNAVLVASHNDRANDVVSKIEDILLVKAICVENKDEASNGLNHIFKAAGIDCRFTVSFFRLNAIVVDTLFGLLLKDSNGENKSLLNSEKIRQTVAVKPYLAPVNGVRLSELSPGNTMRVSFDVSTTLGMKIATKMNLFDKEGNLKSFPAEIFRIIPDLKGGFTIYVKIAGDVYGKAYEEQDIMVKCEDASFLKSSHRLSKKLLFGLILGFLIIGAIVIYLRVVK